jgi:hypothetical protein
MPLNRAISLAGFEADINVLRTTHGAVTAQKSALEAIVTQHNTADFLPKNLQYQTRQAAYNSAIDRPTIDTLLLVGLIASFQRFIKALVSDVLGHHMTSHIRFSELTEYFRNAYLISAASTYRFKASGSVRGVVVNFQRIENSIKECLNDDEGYSLEGEAITSEMGNPTQPAIESIFEKLGLERPFDTAFGAILRENGWSEATNDGDNNRNALRKLAKTIERRNDAVHSFSKIVFEPEELNQLFDFFEIFGRSLFRQVDTQI